MTALKQGHKDDGGKVRVGLFSGLVLLATSKVLMFGAAKYADRNWEKGISYERCFSALQRHLWAWWHGQDNDPEWDQHHLAHAMCCLMFLLHYELERRIYAKFDDRPKKGLLK